MPSDEFRDPRVRLHVLAVDDDVLRLERIRTILGDAGFGVTVSDIAENLDCRISALEPDLVLLDVLMPGLSSRALTQFLAGRRQGRRPYVVLHSPLAPGLLCNLVDVSEALGVIQVTDDDQAFVRTFLTIADRLPSKDMERSLFSERGVPVASGTHRIGAPAAPPLEDELPALRIVGARRS